MINYKVKNCGSKSYQAIANELNIDLNFGLKKEQVNKLRAEFGNNNIYKPKPTSLWNILRESITKPMILLLLTISGLSIIFGKYLESLVMIGVVFAYILVEFINNYRANRIIDKLKEINVQECLVLRDGIKKEIPCQDIVVGDIILLYPGSYIAADAKIISSASLKVDQSVLTGESLPILKNTTNQDHLFAGTKVLDGEAKAIVTCVGKFTEFGKIVKSLNFKIKAQTELQNTMLKLAKVLAIFALVISFIIPALGYLRGYSLENMILTWLALTFLMVPGQPPIIITMALALASLELAKKNILVKNLRGAEIIGFITSIVTDKTGTLTKNKMEPEFIVNSNAQQTKDKQILNYISLALPRYFTDPTDKAVYSLLPKELKKQDKNPVSFHGFSYDRPWRIITYKNSNSYQHFITGKFEDLVKFSSLDQSKKSKLEEIFNNEASLGKRITAFAKKETKSKDLENLENIEFIAFVVLKDPLRPGVKKAFEILKKAGIETFIVTGDHKVTLKAIAQELGIFKDIITGHKLEELNKKKLEKLLVQERLFARVMPNQKLDIVNSLKIQSQTVAVIGDGINDAPALNAASVSIAMGQSGTQVAQQVSDLVLVDDNFANISVALKIGRKFIDNFKKSLTYYLTAKAILITLFIVPLMLNIPFPLLPMHAIIVELIMDLASSTIFIVEPAESNILDKSYIKNTKKLISWKLVYSIIFYGAPLALGILSLYIVLYLLNYNLLLAQTIVLCTWLIGHVLLALNLKQTTRTLINRNSLKNKVGLLWLLFIILFVFVITNFKFAHKYLQTTYIPSYLWLFIILVSIIFTFWIQIYIILKSKKRIQA